MPIFKERLFLDTPFEDLLLGNSKDAKALKEKLWAAADESYSKENTRFIDSLFSIHKEAPKLSKEKLHTELMTLFEKQISPDTREETYINLPHPILEKLKNKIDSGALLTLTDFDDSAGEVMKMLNENFSSIVMKQVVKEKERADKIHELHGTWLAVHETYVTYKKTHKQVDGPFYQSLRTLKRAIEDLLPEDTHRHYLKTHMNSLFSSRARAPDVFHDENSLNRPDVQAFLAARQAFVDICGSTFLEPHQSSIKNSMMGVTNLLDEILQSPAPTTQRLNRP